MQIVTPRPFSKSLVLLMVLFLSLNTITFAQSRPQKGDPPKSGGKKNQRPTPKTEAEIKAEEERRKSEVRLADEASITNEMLIPVQP